MEKRKKKESHVTKRKKSEMDSDGSVYAQKNLKFLGIDNCFSIYLSPQTQRFIECKIGEHITPEKPWIYVQKDKIEDNLFLHDNSSEFLPLRNLIEDYPEGTMLIGCYRTNQEKIEEFMICTTVDAKFKILELIMKEKEEIIEKVKKLIYCEPHTWNSLGSEVEVDGSQNKNNRNLFEVIYESKKPMIIGVEKVKFKYCLASANSKIRTYDEILPDCRFYKKNIFRIRVDRASQVCPGRNNTTSQTILSDPKQKYTQTNEVFVLLNLTLDESQKLNKNLDRLLKFMEDSLLVNFHINLYMNDYEFSNAFIQAHGKESKELLNFHDVIYCKDLCFGSGSWNALISGLIAVSYVETPRKLIVNDKYVNMKQKSTSRSSRDSNMVLLWSYTDNLAPKLYMHANFEITSISFCPYDEDILVGGGCGGQIVIWDLKNKLKQVESKEYLTTNETNNRNLVASHTKWMKAPPGIQHVFPTIVSNMTLSHNSPIISIQWLPSYQHLTKQGQIEDMPIEKDPKCYLHPSKSYQFLTCSMEDSCLFAWEIKQSSHNLPKSNKFKKKPRRLSRLPEPLMKGTSPLRRYNWNFQPFFKLRLKVPGENVQRIFVTEFILSNPNIDYVALNPKTLDNYRERTFFKEIVPVERKPHAQKFVFCSTSGYLAECNWSANEFDQGQMINEQMCDANVFWGIHDGPVHSCRSNIFYPECFLTVGGSVFGIWVTAECKKPLFWRKCSCRYISGVWSLQYPLLCLILREDSYMEYWDFVDCAMKPLRKVKIKGTQIIDVIVDATRSQARKKTYMLTDIKGAIRVHDRAVFNTILNYEEMRISTINVLNNILIQKKYIENLKERLASGFNLRKIHVSETPTPAADKQPNIAAKLSEYDQEKHQHEALRTTKWQRKEEERMYETLMQQKHINITELKQNMLSLIEKLNKRLEQQNKIKQRLAMRKEIFDNQKKFILGTANIVQRKKISVSFPIEMEKIIKEGYLKDYKLIEKEVLAKQPALDRGRHRYVRSSKFSLSLGENEGNVSTPHLRRQKKISFQDNK